VGTPGTLRMRILSTLKTLNGGRLDIICFSVGTYSGSERLAVPMFDDDVRWTAAK
jgi:hypothetical protein